VKINRSAQHEAIRKPYRCAEIFVQRTAPVVVPPVPVPSSQVVPLRMLAPGPDGIAPIFSNTIESTNPLNWRARLKAKWDSASLAGDMWDYWPTDLEALFAWQRAEIELPVTQNKPQKIPAPTSTVATGQDYWEVIARVTSDPRTNRIKVNGALSAPEGTLSFRNNFLAGIMAFGPALVALIKPNNQNEPELDLIETGELFIVGGAIGELLNPADPADPDPNSPSGVDFNRLEIEYELNGTSSIGIKIDYTVELFINVNVASAVTLKGQLRLKYKSFGAQVKLNTNGSMNSVGLSYKDVQAEIVDPGKWSLGGPLGDLIRVAASRMGNGSKWMEFDLEFALDLGVVRLDGATIRAVIGDTVSAELRGLKASINIPGTLKGSGALSVGDAGAIRAMLALQIIPPKISAYGALAIDKDFVAVEVGVQLPVGIPLAGTGLGIFGFMGRFVANGTRDIENDPDPVRRQLRWYEKAPQNKYKRQSGQFAIGLGAIIGTLPDGAFTMNAEGSLSLGFPDVSVVFGINAKILSARKDQATEKGDSASASLMKILGMVVIEPDSVMLGLRASYSIPKILKLEVPFSAYFPTDLSKDWYIRIGSDGHPTRPGDPISLIIFPDILDLKAWAFVMIEQRKLLELGKTKIPPGMQIDSLDFDGFAMGVGAGFDLNWSAGPFHLAASAFILVGMGTKPLLLAGAAGVKGELDVVIACMGVEGFLQARITEQSYKVDAHLCVYIDLWFDTLEKCINIRFEDGSDIALTPPASPIIGMDLCDHRFAIKGSSKANTIAAIPTVWPDTIAVLKWAHYAIDGDPADTSVGAPFKRRIDSPPTTQLWSGSTQLKYAYRLDKVSLWELTGADPNDPDSYTPVAGPIDSAWWLPTHRKAIIEAGPTAIPPSPEEGRELGLFSDEPGAWASWLGDDAGKVPGDPANTVGSVCEVGKLAEPACAFGQNGTMWAGALQRFVATPDLGSAFPSRFAVLAQLPDALPLDHLMRLAQLAQWQWHPGQVEALQGAALVHGATLKEGWQLPFWLREGNFASTAPIVLVPSKHLEQGELVLEICAGTNRRPPIDKDTCDDMPSEGGEYERFTGSTGAHYRGVGQVIIGGAERVFVLSGTRFEGSAALPADAISILIESQKRTVTLNALDSAGSLLAVAQSSGPERQWLTITRNSVQQFSLTSDKPFGIIRVCWGSHDKHFLAEAIGLRTVAEPVVVAFNQAGFAIPLVAVAESRRFNLGRAQRFCPKLSYALNAKDGPYERIEIRAWYGGPISIIALCAVTREMAQAQKANEDYKKSFNQWLLYRADKLVKNKPTRTIALKANRTYQIRVDWQWQRYVLYADPTVPQPPLQTPPATWENAPTEAFTFRTAAFGLWTTPAAVETTSLAVDPAQGGPGYDERTFDPRGLSRFLTRMTPDHEDPPHFLDDPIGAWFMVDHIPSLMAQYDRVLRAKVLHTRPPAGTLIDAPTYESGGLHLLDRATSASWFMSELAWFASDARLIEEAKNAPCVNAIPSRGASHLAITANLEPRSEYDLILEAAPKTKNASAEVVVARTHFYTSRYRNAIDLIQALGFDPDTHPNAPFDAVIPEAITLATLQSGDAELDAALQLLGLDPWPLAQQPRTTAFWLAPSSADRPWRLAGILLEADEPIQRSGFMTGAVGELPQPPRVHVKAIELSRMKLRRFKVNHFPNPPRIVTQEVTESLGQLVEHTRNRSGTRCLFAPSAPIEVKDGLTYRLNVGWLDRGAPGLAMGNYDE
jgi:hypothetical protein